MKVSRENSGEHMQSSGSGTCPRETGASSGTHLSCTLWLRLVQGEWGYSIVRQFAVPALSTRTNSFLLSPQQINTALTSTQPDEQRAGGRPALRSSPCKPWESETPRGLSHVKRLCYSVPVKGERRCPPSLPPAAWMQPTVVLRL